MTRLAAIGVVFALTVLAAPALATPGDLDSSFGTGGSGTELLPNNELMLDGMTPTGDGRVAVIGTTTSGFLIDEQGGLTGVEPVFTEGAIVGADGSQTPLAPVQRPADAGNAGVVVRTSLGIVLLSGGQQHNGASTLDSLRWKLDGSADAAYGQPRAPIPAGIQAPSGFSQPGPGSAVVQGADVIVEMSGVVLRVDESGQFDPTFGAGGIATLPHGFTGGSMALQSNGDIVLSGIGPGVAPGSWALVRLTPAGALDPTFGTAGMATPVGLTLSPGGGPQGVNGLVVRPNDDLVADVQGKLAEVSPNGTAVVPLTSGLTGVPENTQPTIAADSSGRIVIVGNGTGGNTVVARWAADGSVDTTFGLRTLPIPAGPGALAFEGDSPVIAGTECPTPPGQFRQAEIPSSVLVTRLRGDGDNTTALGPALPCPPLSPAPAGDATLTGGAQVGQTLSITAGAWSSDPGPLVYQFYVCHRVVNEPCGRTPRAVDNTYVVAPGDLGAVMFGVVQRAGDSAFEQRTAMIGPVVAAGAPIQPPPNNPNGAAPPQTATALLGDLDVPSTDTVSAQGTADLGTAACPPTCGTIAITGTIASASARAAKAKPKAKPKPKPKRPVSALTAKHFTVTRGHKVKLSLHLTSAALARLRHAKSLRIVLTITFTPSAHGAKKVVAHHTVTLREPRAKVKQKKP